MVSQPVAHAPFPVEAGSANPCGATSSPTGINFSLASANATGVELLLFAVHDSLHPFQTIRFDPYLNKTFHIWHAFVRGLKPGAHYAYRVDGPSDSAAQRFNRNKVLVDPYSRGKSDTLWDRGRACPPEDNMSKLMRSIAIDPSGYDWEGDQPLRHPMADSIIYEAHVRGFTQSRSVRERASSRGAKRGSAVQASVSEFLCRHNRTPVQPEEGEFYANRRHPRDRSPHP